MARRWHFVPSDEETRARNTFRVAKASRLIDSMEGHARRPDDCAQSIQINADGKARRGLRGVGSSIFSRSPLGLGAGAVTWLGGPLRARAPRCLRSRRLGKNPRGGGARWGGPGGAVPFGCSGRQTTASPRGTRPPGVPTGAPAWLLRPEIRWVCLPSNTQRRPGDFPSGGASVGEIPVVGFSLFARWARALYRQFTAIPTRSWAGAGWRAFPPLQDIAAYVGPSENSLGGAGHRVDPCPGQCGGRRWGAKLGGNVGGGVVNKSVAQRSPLALARRLLWGGCLPGPSASILSITKSRTETDTGRIANGMDRGLAEGVIKALPRRNWAMYIFIGRIRRCFHRGWMGLTILFFFPSDPVFRPRHAGLIRQASKLTSGGVSPAPWGQGKSECPRDLVRGSVWDSHPHTNLLGTGRFAGPFAAFKTRFGWPY